MMKGIRTALVKTYFIDERDQNCLSEIKYFIDVKDLH